MMPAQSRTHEVSLQALLGDWLTLEQDCPISSIALDSRQVQPGGLFLAIAGTAQHGLQHMQQALAAGASAVVYDPAGEGAALAQSFGLDSSVLLLALDGLAHKASVIADRFYAQPSSELAVIGITGTNGKTSCSHFLGQVLDAPRPAGVIGTLGWGLSGDLIETRNTTPDPISLQAHLADLKDWGARCVAMEVSSHGMAQGRVSGIRFQGAVFTNLGRDHLDYHRTIDAYAAAKQQLFAQADLQFAVLNAADPAAHIMRDALAPTVQVLAYASGPLAGDWSPIRVLRAEAVQTRLDGLVFQAVLGEERAEVCAAVLGRFNVDNLLAVMAVLLARGVSLAEAARRMAALRSIPGRMEAFGSAAQTPTVIVDYAHTADALDNALNSLRPHCPGRLITVFGCGGDRDTGKRPLMGQVAEQLSERVIVTDDNPRGESPAAIVADILAGIASPDAVEVIHDRAQAIERAVFEAGPQDIVLVAGKGHETTQQVGDQVLAFSDRQCVRETLLRRSNPPQDGSGCKR